MLDRFPIVRNALRPEFFTRRRCMLGAFAFFILMIAIGSLPGKAHAASSIVGDKPLHLIAYAVLPALVYGALRGTPMMRGAATLLIIALLGAADEAIQALLPYRFANWADWKFDMLAAISCIAVLMLLPSLQSGRTPMTGCHPESIAPLKKKTP